MQAQSETNRQQDGAYKPQISKVVHFAAWRTWRIQPRTHAPDPGKRRACGKRPTQRPPLCEIQPGKIRHMAGEGECREKHQQRIGRHPQGSVVCPSRAIGRMRK